MAVQDSFFLPRTHLASSVGFRVGLTVGAVGVCDGFRVGGFVKVPLHVNELHGQKFPDDPKIPDISLKPQSKVFWP